jgi:hypothetical protein
MPNLRLVAVMVAAAVAVTILWQWLLDEPQVAPPRMEVVEDTVSSKIFHATATAAKTTTVPASAPIPQPAASVPITSELARQLLGAKDIKVIALEALKRSEKGGAFLAALALGHCQPDDHATFEQRADAAVRAIITATSTISYERISAINAWLSSCSGFSVSEVESLRAQALQHGVDGSDRLAALARGMNTTERGTPERAKIEQDVLDSGSSTLISWVLEIEMFRVDSTAAKRRPLPVSVGAQLGACVEGEYCSMDFGMVTVCSYEGDCYVSREDYARDYLLNGNVEDFEKAKVIAAEIRSAIARRDRSVFR